MLTRQVDVLIQIPNAEIQFANAFGVLLISMEHAKRVSLFTQCLVVRAIIANIKQHCIYII